jgi:hypothetical protein
MLLEVAPESTRRQRQGHNHHHHATNQAIAMPLTQQLMAQTLLAAGPACQQAKLQICVQPWRMPALLLAMHTPAAACPAGVQAEHADTSTAGLEQHSCV